MEILNTETVSELTWWVALFIFISIIIGLIFLVAAGEAFKGSEILAGILASVMALAFLSGAVLLGNSAGVEHEEYEVIVTDYNELHEGGYEIVEERGEITVIREAE